MAIVKTLIVKGVARFLTDAYMSTIRSGIWNGSTIQVGYGGTGVTSAVGDQYTPVFLSSSGIAPCTVAIPHNTKDFKINGTTYSIFTTYTGTAPTIFAPTALAGTGGYILATNSAKNGLEWVAKPATNVPTSAVVSSSATGTSQITAAQSDPYYNLLEGGAVARSIQFLAGSNIGISAATDGRITFTNTGVRSVTIYGNYLRVNTNGTNADLTIPYATATSVLNSTQISTEADITQSGVRAYTGIGTSWEGDVTSMAYAAILTFGDYSRGWQMWAQRATALGMYWRRGDSGASAWEDPRLFLDSVNTSASVSGNTLTLTIGGSATTYAPSLANLVVQIFNSTKTLKVSEWTTIAAVNTYDAGTYALQISSGTTLYASGVFSLCKNNDAINDEIPLHVSSTSNAWRPYARISGNNLQMSSTEATGTSRSYTVKIFKLI